VTSCSSVTARSGLCLSAIQEAPHCAGNSSDTQISSVESEQPGDAAPAGVRVGSAATAPRVAPAIGVPSQPPVNSWGFCRHVRQSCNRSATLHGRIFGRKVRAWPPRCVVRLNAVASNTCVRRHQPSQPSGSVRNELRTKMQPGGVGLMLGTLFAAWAAMGFALARHCCWHALDALRKRRISGEPREHVRSWPITE
jgi:hypothetical protein